MTAVKEHPTGGDNVRAEGVVEVQGWPFPCQRLVVWVSLLEYRHG